VSTTGFALHHSQRSEVETARVGSQSELGTRFDDTVMAWESWSELDQATKVRGATWCTPDHRDAWPTQPMQAQVARP